MAAEDLTLNPILGFSGSTWRTGTSSYVPDYATYAPTVIYTGAPYGLPAAGYDYNVNVSNLYGEVFWNTFFEVAFPSITSQNFLAEMSTGTPGGYFMQMYSIAMLDFYDSYFQGRDDTGSLNSTANTTTVPSTFDFWLSSDLTDDDKRLIIAKFLKTRGAVADQTYTDADGNIIYRNYTQLMYLNNLNLRSTNIFFYVASLMVSIMNELQNNTINAARYATRLAQTQQALSAEMTSDRYAYVMINSANDYSTININENNGQALENLRIRRDIVQKETDQASTFLETSQQAVESAASKSLDFLKKGTELVSLFYRAF